MSIAFVMNLVTTFTALQDVRRYNMISGNNTWPQSGQMVELDSRCVLKFGGLDTELSTLFLHGESGEEIGSIKIQQQSSNLVITVSSSISCNKDKDICEKTMTASRTETVAFTCSLQFAGSKTLEGGNSLTCGGATFGIDSENEIVHSLRDAVQMIKFVSAEGIGYYLLECPDKTQYNKKNLCGNSSMKGLNPDTDFVWRTNGRSTFAIDWNLYCGGEVLRSILGSVFYGGAMMGTFVGGNLFDQFGRKTGALVGYSMVAIATLAASFAPSIWFMFVCRFLQGAGVYIGVTGGIVLLLEYTALRFRIQANSGVQLTYGVGYIINVGFAYFIKNWNWLLMLVGILYILSIVPLLLLPDSPRYFLVNKRDEKNARKSLKWLAKINGSDFDVDTIHLKDEETSNVTQKTVKEPSFLDTMKDFLKYKELLVQLLIQMWLWLVAGFLYNGFSFSWNELGDNIYISYLFAALGEILAYLGMGFPIKYLGRRFSIMVFYLVASLTFLIALIPVKLSSTFSLEQLSCLIGSMFVSAASCALYLYSAELAPTSHRGKILGYSSLAARIGNHLTNNQSYNCFSS